MLAPSGGLLRAGLALKLNQVKLATRSYLRDRTDQATDTVTSYAVAAGLYAAAGIFLIAACLVGIAALFRWIEIKYGLFPAFGAVGVLLLAIAAICATMAASRLKRPPRHFPALASRLRVAVKSSPLRPDPVDAAADGWRAATSPTARVNRPQPNARRSAGRDSGNVRTGLILAGALLGWVAVRRRRQAWPADH
jgi:hypothetical protein